jgi:hypothetical protein
MKDSSMAQIEFSNTQVVFQLLLKLEQATMLSTAVSQRFQNIIVLDAQEKQVLEDLAQWGMIQLIHELNVEIKSFQRLQEESNAALQQIKALNIRKRTLEMQLRNVSDEISKLGFFGSKQKQELELKASQFAFELNDLNQKTNDLNRKLELPDDQLKVLIEKVNQQQNDDLVCLDCQAVYFKREAQILLSELQQMNQKHFQDQPLAQVLQYGFMWNE